MNNRGRRGGGWGAGEGNDYLGGEQLFGTQGYVGCPNEQFQKEKKILRHFCSCHFQQLCK